ncbi:MAG TPA: type 1 glutamine amidotransferase [Sedimentisphaerales bacterium]|jgi:GMP synthase-like glutamine amidotransferase|nr:type 1 glutamine amidotransferase [Sedimentisphaerales bacterium]HNU28736.1 type 1 glutamine amidotransferase [Sedimentisphaerales bacterium]
MRVHYLQHVPFEDAANIAVWAESRNHVVTQTRLYENEPLPEIDEVGLLAIMGGPMNVYQYRNHPWLKREKAFIERAVVKGVPILGVCLGAQLLADVLGGKVVQNPHIEIGWFPVRLTPEARDSVLFKGVPAEFNAFHWHGDTFDIPPGARRLAQSDACPNQAFEYAGRAVGLQFHLEYTADSIHSMLAHCADELTEAPFIQSRDRILAQFDQIAHTGKLLFALLDSMLGSEQAVR